MRLETPSKQKLYRDVDRNCLPAQMKLGAYIIILNRLPCIKFLGYESQQLLTLNFKTYGMTMALPRSNFLYQYLLRDPSDEIFLLLE